MFVFCIAENMFVEKPVFPNTENDGLSHGRIWIATAGRKVDDITEIQVSSAREFTETDTLLST